MLATDAIRLIPLIAILVPPIAGAAPFLRANGSAQSITLGETASLSLYAGDDGADLPAAAEWWAVAETPAGWFAFRAGAGWSTTIAPAHQGAPGPMTHLHLLEAPRLPRGLYTLYFGYDLTLDGVVDPASLRYTRLTVTVGTPSPVAACGERRELFSVDPLEAERYHSIVGLGATNPSGHTFPTVHSYLMLSDPTTPAPVYAPGEVTITGISRMENLNAGSTDYVLQFTPCTEVYGYFDHVTTLTDELLAAAGEFTDCWTYEDGSYRLCANTLTIPLAAGTPVGWAGGPLSRSGALDFGLRDERIAPLHYAAPERLANGDQRFVVCPYDYYREGTVKEGLFAKLRAFRDDPPVCGEVAYDLDGTARGRWYLEGGEGSGEHGNIALVPSVQSPSSVGVLSIGNPEVGIDAYYFDYREGGRINRPFEAVTADGHTYCWDTLRNRESTVASGNAQPLDGILYLTLEDATHLHLEQDSSRQDCPSDPDALAFGDAAVRFQR